MRYGIANFDYCHACGELADLCLDCGCCENCCGNGFECPSSISDDEEDKFFEFYWEETPPKKAKEVETK